MTTTNENPEQDISDQLSEDQDEAAGQDMHKLPETFAEILPDGDLLNKLNTLGFVTPTEVQAHAIAPALSGVDLIVQAQTGSGKTLAFVLPMVLNLLEEIEKGDAKSTFAIVLSPTRELANQIQEVLVQVCSDIEAVLLIGGADIDSQKRALKRDRRIVVGTPGRVLDMMRQKALRLDRCRYFVLDEADEMLSMGFIEDIRAILSRLPNRRQGMFVSATITGRVEMLAHTFLNKPERILVGDYSSDIPAIEHCYLEVGGELMAKPAALCDLIETARPRSAIIFCNTKSDTKLVEALLRRRGFDARRINSDLTQSQRNRIMNKIRAQELQFLIATDIAARGIDIEQIDLVVNYNLHDQHETYIHRTGRTGRAGRSGRAVSLVGPRDHSAFYYLRQSVDFEFVKLDPPTDGEIADARLSHLYEVLRESKTEVNENDYLVSAKLIKELSGDEEPSEGLIEIIAKLCRHTIEHFIAEEAKSLDEELSATAQEERKEKGSDGKRERRRDKGDDRRERRGRDREEDGREKDDSTEGRKRERKRRDERSRDKKSAPSEIRLYIGLGTSQGLTAEVFSDLALELAELETADLRKLTVREFYGFVDMYEHQARRLIKALDGFEFNEQALVVEKAAELTSSRPARHRGDRGRDNRRGKQGGSSRRGSSRGSSRDNDGRGRRRRERRN